MRTQGNFNQIYAAAKSFYNDNDDDKPLDPVVRHTNNGIWMLESGIEPEPDADAECRLNDFDNYWYITYNDPDYIPSTEDENNFLSAITDENQHY